MSEEREPDDVDRALHGFDHLLDVVHDKILRPILLVGRTIAFSFILLLMAIVLVTTLVIGLIRLLNVYAFAGREWLTFGVVGILALAVGLWIWRRRRPVALRKK